MKEQFGNLFSHLVREVSGAVQTIAMPQVAKRERPDANIEEDEKLNRKDREHAARLMRVNHCGEVCAQALYQGQALFARDTTIRESLQEAADEEIDHLAWTAERIDELGGRQSILNPIWYAGSFALGAGAALISDKISLGFVAETEKQVSEHLQSHIDKLPEQDVRSKAIVTQMDIDERQHATTAIEMGGVELPEPAKKVMHLFGKVMTTTSHWI